VEFVPDPVRTPWWQQSRLLAVLGAVTLALIVLNILGRNWLGLGATVLLLFALVSLWWSFRQQQRHRSVEGPGN
jgi:Flp pilus assembly protein TadB